MTFPFPYVVPSAMVYEMIARNLPSQAAGVQWALGGIRSVQTGSYESGSFVPEVKVPGSGSYLMQLFNKLEEVGIFGPGKYSVTVVFAGSVDNSQWSGIEVGGEFYPRSVFGSRSTGSGSWTNYTMYKSSARSADNLDAWLFDSSLGTVPNSFPSYLDGSVHQVRIVP